MAEDLESLSVPELKKILKNKNLPVSGRKSDLIKRLVDENAKDIQISIPLYSENNLWRRLGNKKWELSNGYVISAVHVFVSLMVILSTAGLGAYAVSQFNSKTPDYTLIQFDSSKAREYTQMLVDLGHPEWNGRMSGSVEEQATVDAIQQNFTEMGLMLQYETFNVPMFEIRSEPELSMCVPGEYPFSLQSPTPCGTTDINAEIITFNHLTDFVLQGYSGTREIQFWQDEFTIANLSDGSDDSLWDNASGQVGLLWLDSVGVTSNTEFYAKARDSSLAGLIIAIEKGKDLAGQFNLYSDRIERLKDQIFKKSENAVTSVNLLSEQISAINAKLLASGGAGDSSNALLDQRDLLIDQLSEVSQITVTYINKGAAEIRLGNTGSGPVIVEADSSPTKGSIGTVPIDIIKQGPRLQPVVGSGNIATNQIQAGIIAGLVDAYALADDTLKEIDNLEPKD